MRPHECRPSRMRYMFARVWTLAPCWKCGQELRLEPTVQGFAFWETLHQKRDYPEWTPGDAQALWRAFGGA